MNGRDYFFDLIVAPTLYSEQVSSLYQIVPLESVKETSQIPLYPCAGKTLRTVLGGYCTQPLKKVAIRSRIGRINFFHLFKI